MGFQGGGAGSGRPRGGFQVGDFECCGLCRFGEGLCLWGPRTYGFLESGRM